MRKRQQKLNVTFWKLWSFKVAGHNASMLLFLFLCVLQNSYWEMFFYLLRFLLNLSYILLTQMGLPYFLWSGNFPNSVSMLTFSEVSRFQALHELNTSFLLFSFTYASHQQRACQTKAGSQFSPNKLAAMIPYYPHLLHLHLHIFCVNNLNWFFKCFVRSKNPWHIRKYFERFFPL